VVSEPPLLGGEVLLPSEPAENLALERGGALPNLASHLIDLQMPGKVGVETFIRELFVSEVAGTIIRGIMAQGHRAKLVSKVTEVGLSGL
jgi:hypothetical protein